MKLSLQAVYLAAVSVSAAQETAKWPLQSFKSTPFQAPYMNVTKHGQTELGYLFVSPHDILRETGYPTIYDDDGQLVWRGPQMNISAYQPQMLDGEPVLAYWNGYLFDGFGFGGISILNSSYDEIYHVTLPRDHKFSTVADPQTFESYIDIHESQITNQGTILVTAVNITQMDLSSIGGPKDGWVQDGLFYEIDIKTNEVLFRWSTVEHLSEVPLSDIVLPLEDSGQNKTAPFEYPHLNSVAKYGDSYLVSSRFMCTLFFIDKHGNVAWHLHGQKGGSFTLTPEASFCFQHDARFISQTDESITLQLHNNENADYTSDTKITTGLILSLDLKENTASAVQRFWDAGEPVFSHSQGSYQNLSNGHVLLQHGATPKLEEYDEDGALVMRARFGYDETLQSYRGYRTPWLGRPKTVPDVVACVEKDRTVVYVSWNGATDVQSWRVTAQSDFEEVRTVPKNGFETEIRLDILTEKVLVEAVGGVGDGTKSKVTVGDVCQPQLI